MIIISQLFDDWFIVGVAYIVLTYGEVSLVDSHTVERQTMQGIVLSDFIIYYSILGIRLETGGGAAKPYYPSTSISG